MEPKQKSWVEIKSNWHLELLSSLRWFKIQISFPYSPNPSWWMIIEFPKSHQRYIESRVALQKHCEDIFGRISILFKKWKHEIRNEKCCWGQKSINLLEKAPFKSRPAEFEYWFFDRLTSHFPHWILSTGILTHCASWHLSNILQGSPAKGESTLCPSFNFNPSSVLPSCRQKKLVTARALTFIFSSLGLLGITLASKSSRREIFWARAVCRLAGGLGGCGVLQTTDFKRKARPNQTPFEDTGEARGADARLLRMRTSRPSRHQAATARGGGGG